MGCEFEGWPPSEIIPTELAARTDGTREQPTSLSYERNTCGVEHFIGEQRADIRKGSPKPLVASVIGRLACCTKDRKNRLDSRKARLGMVSPDRRTNLHLGI